jgi:hypothetical protein
MIRTAMLVRPALCAAVGLAVLTGGTFVAAPAMAQKAPKPPKLALSKPFQTAAAPLGQAIEDAKKRPDVVAATNNVNAAQATAQSAQGAARTQARAQVDAAVAALGNTLSAEKAQLDAAFTAASTPDDRYMAGNLAVNLGGVAKDTKIQRRGLEAMLASGKVAPADAPRLQYYLGQFAFDSKDYATARTALGAAVQAGFTENDVDALLAEAYLSDNQVPQGLTMLKQAIDKRNATPNKDKAAEFAMGLVGAYPTADNWAGAITVVREIGKYPAQETLDLMRLMDRTKSYAEERDYIEYIQAADARRLPGEVIRVLDAGKASGKLRANDPFIVEARTVATGRLAADRASLPTLERDGRAANASAVTATGAADAFLSYGEAAKAEVLYTMALNKPGAEKDRILTRLGIAQLDQGKHAEAQASFGKVTGARRNIAQLWALYAAQKAAGTAGA